MIKMLFPWRQTLSLVILIINITPTAGLFNSIASDVKSAASSAETAASQVVENLEGDLTSFEQAVETKLSSALNSSHGVIAQIAMGHELYVTRYVTLHNSTPS
jgi:hypothetical protein